MTEDELTEVYGIAGVFEETIQLTECWVDAHGTAFLDRCTQGCVHAIWRSHTDWARYSCPEAALLAAHRRDEAAGMLPAVAE